MLERWRERDVFAESVRRRRGAPPWGFYEGPPTANGPPGSHHVLARVFKDIFPRYKTMCGYYVERKGGWDCHGLPVELAVEAELGFTSQGRHRALRDRRVQRPLPREGAQPRRGLEPADRADRLLDRPRRRLPDARPGVRRVGVVGAEDDPRQGAAVREAEGRPVLPPRRDDALEPRARPARRLPGRPRPVGVRAPAGAHGIRRPLRQGDRAARVDDDAVDARLQRRGRGRPGPTYVRARSRDEDTVFVARRGAPRARARAGRRGARHVPRARARGDLVRAAVRVHPGERLRRARAHRAAGRLRHRRRRHRARPHRDRVRRGRLPPRRAATG